MIFWLWLSFLVPVLITPQAALQAIRPGQPPEGLAAGSKTAIIRGKTTNAKTGSPVKDVRVTLRLSGHGEVAGSATSDTNGGYEMRVAPGLYNLSAAKDGFVLTPYLDVANVPVLELGAVQEAVVDLRLRPGATIAGTVTDVSGAPIPDANLQATMKIYRRGKTELQLRATARTNVHGEYRLTNLPAGSYYLQAGKRGIAGPGVRTFVPMIYPGASRIEDAQSIKVDAGEDKSAINFRLRDAIKYSVSGRVTFLASGQPVANIAIRADPDFPGFGMNASTQSRADGTFRLEGLTAGGYRTEGKLIGDSHGSPHGYFLKFFEVTAADITNLIIRVGDGTTLKGTLRAAGGSLPERMSVQAFVRNPLGGTGYVQTAIAAADGTFEIRGVQPGICDLAITSDPASAGRAREFFVGPLTVDGQDVSDSGIQVPEGTAPVEVSVTVDFRPGTITGKTLDFEDRPIPGANVTLTSADPKKRLLYPYWREIKSDRQGAFRLGSLVPGDYLLMIWPGCRPWAGLDPEALAILEKHAVRVRVEQSGVVSRNLPLTKEVRDMLWFEGQAPQFPNSVLGQPAD